MSRIIAVYNPVQKISSAIANKIYAAEKFLENQTHQKTFTIRNNLLLGKKNRIKYSLFRNVAQRTVKRYF